MSAITNTDSYLSRVHRINSTRSTLSQAITALSLIVILVVFWSLKLTGITMAGEAFCGIDEHVHGDSCPTGSLICPLEETEGHIHDESCILCELLCELEEVSPHVHDEECLHYELTCPEEEAESHSHGDSCYIKELTCTEEERTGHTHGEECYTHALICTTDDPEHIHGPECYEDQLACYNEESEGHTHNSSCYTAGEDLLCELEETEGHIHTEECFVLIEDSYICGLEETEGHVHNEECYYFGIGFGCGLTEAEGHVHTEDCLTDETELGCGLDSIPEHFHLEECYEALEECPLEEHIHTEECYCNLDADVETIDDWEDTLPDISQETSTGAAVVSVARSQLDYTESTLNFEVDAQGIRRGITRYGQWYGNPYGDWSAMFASFCLHYADTIDLPFNAGPESMRLEWEEEELYLPADGTLPPVGSLLFLTEEDEYGFYGDTAAAVAIVAEIDEEENCMTVIQGDLEDTVQEYEIEIDDPAILGYGLVPESSPFAMLMAPRAGGQALATTLNYTNNTNLNNRNFILYTEYNGQYYAMNCEPGSGVAATIPAVPITIADGKVYSDVADPNRLFWSFTADGSNYKIRNLGTNRALHPGQNENGLLYDEAWSTRVDRSESGARFGHTSGDYGVYFNYNNGNPIFERRSGRDKAAVIYFAESMPAVTVWLDGTQGNLMPLRGSDLTSYSVPAGSTMQLPSEWKSPTKYAYELRGWYNVASGAYYEPGQEIVVEENMLLYADWRAASYDIGQMNSDVLETVSTNSFITTRVFDYNSLFNTLSMNNNYNPATGGNSTTWTLVENGQVNTTGKETLNFIFGDHDSDGHISHPNNRNDENGEVYQEVTPGLYNEELAELLFDPDVDVIGKEYIGTGDYLFNYGEDPSDSEHYGYYYYDSKLNAAAYNQSRGRFYIYDYLEQTTDSPGNNNYSDFLPFNSPYTNTNGNNIPTFTHNGQSGYAYDARYDGDDNAASHVHTDYALGMSIEMDFYLAAKPGTVDENGTLANQSITGHDMVFEFSGDDDVWVLIDGKMVLDIGGIHLGRSGSIDFSTGEVVVYGDGDNQAATYTGSVTYLEPGEHTLTMYYLERGASMSNFKLRFNLTTRYAMTLRKEDTLTAQLLNGAQFAVYTDESCSKGYEAKLWTNKSAYENGDTATNLFTVKNGYVEMWGLAAGNTYYLKEVRGPDVMDGVPAQGVIRMRLNNDGLPDYEVLPDGEGDLTVGYTVHGYKVNEDLQEAYLVITNTEPSQQTPVEVTAEKIWNDSENHDGDEVTVYLVANGTRIQEVVLSADNDWKHTWTNLPSVDRNGKPVVYRVQESTVPGYISTVTDKNADSSGTTIMDASTFENGQTYLLSTPQGYIGAANSGDKVALNKDLQTVQKSAHYLWKAKVNSDGTVELTNQNDKDLFFDSTSKTYRVKTGATNVQLKYGTNKNLYFTVKGGSSWRPTYTDYYLGALNNNGYFSAPTSSSSTSILAITPQIVMALPPPPVPETDGETPIRDFNIVNTPVGDAVESLKVHKVWDAGSLGSASDYEELSVEMELLANGKPSGLIGTLNLRNDWTYIFIDLPMFDSYGEEISYAVREVDLPDDWRVEYGPVSSINGSQAAFETTVTNIYTPTGPLLPATGSMGRTLYMLCGSSLMLFSLVYGFVSRRTRERRTK